MSGESEIIAFLIERHEPEAIILVGSRADGAERPGSDWDLYLLLPETAERVVGVLSAPSVLDDELLDVGLIRLPIADDQVPSLFGPNLQQARVLLDNAAEVARRICELARRRYAAGRGLTARERQLRKHELARNLARMRARAAQRGAYFEAVAWYFHLAHRSWFEILHDRWSLSVHRALPEIQRVDPSFHRLLATLIEEARPDARIRAAEAIFRLLFPEGVTHPSI